NEADPLPEPDLQEAQLEERRRQQVGERPPAELLVEGGNRRDRRRRDLPDRRPARLRDPLDQDLDRAAGGLDRTDRVAQRRAAGAGAGAVVGGWARTAANVSTRTASAPDIGKRVGMAPEHARAARGAQSPAGSALPLRRLLRRGCPLRCESPSCSSPPPWRHRATAFPFPSTPSRSAASSGRR